MGNVLLIYNGKTYELTIDSLEGALHIQNEGNYRCCINKLIGKQDLRQDEVDGKPKTMLNGVHIEELIRKLENDKAANKK